MVGVIGVVLAVVTIAAHREHTAAVIDRTAGTISGPTTRPRRSASTRARSAASWRSRSAPTPPRSRRRSRSSRPWPPKYKGDAEEIQHKAGEEHEATERAEHRALRFDLGEGFIELGLVLSSLYFLGRQRLFPLVGGASALIGFATALSALLL